MGDDGSSGPPAKKRGAMRQISKDDRSDSEEESSIPSVSGSFQKASDEVIASRRIVKVRRLTPSQGPAAPNPFASIRLVPSGASSGVLPAAFASAPALALAGESVEKEVEVKDELFQLGSKDEEGYTGKIEVDSTGDVNTCTHAGDKGERKVENGEDKLEMPKSPVIQDDSKEKSVVSGGDVGREPAKTLTTDTGLERGKSDDLKSEESNECNRKSQVNDGIKQNSEAKELITPKEGDAHKDQESGAVGTSNVADDGGASKDAAPTCNAANARSFSFGTSPFLFETPTAFASFSSTWTTFGSSTASGTSSGTSFAFGTAGSEGSFALSSSPFSASNGSSFQFLKSSQSSCAPLNTGPPLQTPASSVQFQGGITPTGEEEEKMVFGADATLFEFIDSTWKERGKGELRVNVPSGKAGNARLLMRSKGNLRLILNAGLFADMKMTNMNSRGVTFACVNSAVVEKSGMATYALKFRDSIAAGNFRDAVDANKSPPQESLKTPENSPTSLHGA